MTHKSFYSVISTIEVINGQKSTMFGVVASNRDKAVTVKGLSEDKERVEALVKTMNDANLEIEQFLDVVDDFMFSNYGYVKP